MATFEGKTKYAVAEDVTITLSGLADDTSVASSEIDNSSDLYEDYQFDCSVKTNAAGVSATGKIQFYAVAALDDSGRTYPTNNKGRVPLGLPMDASVNGITYDSNLYTVAQSFGGRLPNYFKIVIDNQTGAALDATEGNHNKRGQGILRQSVEL